MQHILLIEDDPELAGYLTDFLRDEGYAVTHAAGQTDGLRAFHAGQFDCLLLDLSLQDGNGFSVCASVRRESDIPVLFLTASADEACTVTGLELGADDYIGKPFRPRELIARMKNATYQIFQKPTPTASGQWITTHFACSCLTLRMDT